MRAVLHLSISDVFSMSTGNTVLLDSGAEVSLLDARTLTSNNTHIIDTEIVHLTLRSFSGDLLASDARVKLNTFGVAHWWYVVNTHTLLP